MTSTSQPQATGATQPPKGVKYFGDLDKIPHISARMRRQLRPVAQRYAFRANDYYLGLINWDDPHDPIQRLIIPCPEELDDGGRLDASNEQAVTVAPGVQHKYPDTALLLCNEVCGGFCRYCFRKRLFMNGNDEVGRDISAGIAYVAAHPEITNVLLTGGDPLLMSTRRLVEILSRLRDIPHVQIIRIGSKMPAFNPWRVLDDAELLEALDHFSTPQRRIYLMAHFDHPRELTEPAIQGIEALIRHEVICVNQCPLIHGVNDHPDTLADLFQKLAWIGCPPYYLFQCRPTAGNRPYQVPLVRGWEIFRQALRQGSGLARRARYVMSHESGKIEILGVDAGHIYLCDHQPKDITRPARIVAYHRDEQACWLDQLRPINDEGPETAAAPQAASEHIVCDPAVLGGKPCIKGTRITVESLLEMMASGINRQEILTRYPHLIVESIEDALRYAARFMRQQMAWAAE